LRTAARDPPQRRSRERLAYVFLQHKAGQSLPPTGRHQSEIIRCVYARVAGFGSNDSSDPCAPLIPRSPPKRLGSAGLLLPRRSEGLPLSGWWRGLRLEGRQPALDDHSDLLTLRQGQPGEFLAAGQGLRGRREPSKMESAAGTSSRGSARARGGSARASRTGIPITPKPRRSAPPQRFFLARRSAWFASPATKPGQGSIPRDPLLGPSACTHKALQQGSKFLGVRLASGDQRAPRARSSDAKYGAGHLAARFG